MIICNHVIISGSLKPGFIATIFKFIFWLRDKSREIYKEKHGGEKGGKRLEW